MTVTVKYDGYPDRLACEVCSCEVGALGRPTWVAYDLATGLYGWHTGAGYRAPDVDEPPIHCDAECGCRCHGTARAFLRNHYDEEAQ
jgi:hypothetical protein